MSKGAASPSTAAAAGLEPRSFVEPGGGVYGGGGCGVYRHVAGHATAAAGGESFGRPPAATSPSFSAVATPHSSRHHAPPPSPKATLFGGGGSGRGLGASPFSEGQSLPPAPPPARQNQWSALLDYNQVLCVEEAQGLFQDPAPSPAVPKSSAATPGAAAAAGGAGGGGALFADGKTASSGGSQASGPPVSVRSATISKNVSSESYERPIVSLDDIVMELSAVGSARFYVATEHAAGGNGADGAGDGGLGASAAAGGLSAAAGVPAAVGTSNRPLPRVCIPVYQVASSLLGQCEGGNVPPRALLTRKTIYSRTAIHSNRPAIYAPGRAFGQPGLFYSLRVEDLVFLVDLCCRRAAVTARKLTWQKLRWLLTQLGTLRNSAKHSLDEENEEVRGAVKNDGAVGVPAAGVGPAGAKLGAAAAPAAGAAPFAALIPPALARMSLDAIVLYRQNMHPFVTDEVFAYLVNLFELSTGAKSECVPAEQAFAEARAALGPLAPQPSVLREVYAFWKLRRFLYGKSLLRCLWPVSPASDGAPFAAFRARTKEKMVLRRPRRFASESAARLSRLCAEFERSEKLFRTAKARDWLKLQICDIEAVLFEQLWKEKRDPAYRHVLWDGLRARLIAEAGSAADFSADFGAFFRRIAEQESRTPKKTAHFASLAGAAGGGRHKRDRLEPAAPPAAAKRAKVEPATEVPGAAGKSAAGEPAAGGVAAVGFPQSTPTTSPPEAGRAAICASPGPAEPPVRFLSPVPLPPLCVCLPASLEDSAVWAALARLGVRPQRPVGVVKLQPPAAPGAVAPVFVQTLDALPAEIRHPRNLQFVIVLREDGARGGAAAGGAGGGGANDGGADVGGAGVGGAGVGGANVGAPAAGEPAAGGAGAGGAGAVSAGGGGAGGPPPYPALVLPGHSPSAAPGPPTGERTSVPGMPSGAAAALASLPLSPAPLTGIPAERSFFRRGRAGSLWLDRWTGAPPVGRLFSPERLLPCDFAAAAAVADVGPRFGASDAPDANSSAFGWLCEARDAPSGTHALGNALKYVAAAAPAYRPTVLACGDAAPGACAVAEWLGASASSAAKKNPQPPTPPALALGWTWDGLAGLARVHRPLANAGSLEPPLERPLDPDDSRLFPLSMLAARAVRNESALRCLAARKELGAAAGGSGGEGATIIGSQHRRRPY